MSRGQRRVKKLLWYLVAVFVWIGLLAGRNTPLAAAQERDASSPRELTVYPAPAGESLSQDYRVEVNGIAVPVYTARVNDPPYNHLDYGGTYSFISFDFTGHVTITISASQDIRGARIRPLSMNIRDTPIDPHRTTFEIDRPVNLSFEPDGKKHPLLIFANPPEQNAPKEGDADVIFFGPGIYHPAGGVIRLKSNQTLYIAGGAVVHAAVFIENAENVDIRGRGILDGSEWPHEKGPKEQLLEINSSRHVRVEGIVLRGSYGWTLVPVNSEDVTIENVKICGGRVSNDDGIDIANSRHVLIRDSFIRTDDDCIALKGLNNKWGDVDDIRVEDSILWCDRARITLMGHESRAKYMQDIIYRDIDIIHFSMAPFLLQPGEEMTLQNVLFEDIRLNGAGQEDLAVINPTINQYMVRKVPGHIRNIEFRNLTLSGMPGGYRVVLAGHDKRHKTEDVKFENVNVLGKPLTKSYAQLSVGKYTEDIVFIPDSGGHEQ